MRAIITATLIAGFLLISLTTGELVERAVSCASVTKSCSTAYGYCSRYLDIRPQRTTVKVTVSTVTVTTQKTAGTETTNVCPTHGPANKKRDFLNSLEEREAEPDSVLNNDFDSPIEKRQARPPNCLTKAGTQSAQLSSACSCFNYPTTSSTRTVTRTTTVKGAPTKTRYTETVTITTVQPSPTCNVASTNAGNTIAWKEFYGVCFGLRSCCNTPTNSLSHFYPANVPLCEALNRCANDTIGEGANTFELAFVDFSNRQGGPSWYCAGYRAGPSPLVIDTADNWYETYGYYHS